MIFSFAISLVLIFSFALDKLVKRKFFLVFLLILFPMYFLQALQNEVGTDYLSYRRIVESLSDPELYLRKGEFFFYGVITFIRYTGLPTQTLFILYAFLFWLLTAYILTRLAVLSGQNIFIITALFLLSSNVYYNQYNGIRQYLSASFFSVVVLIWLDGRRLTGYLALIMMNASHATGFVVTPLALFMRPLSPNRNLIVFIGTFVLYLVAADVIIELVFKYLLPSYSRYLDSQYARGISSLNFILRIYDLPVILVFWFFYVRSKKSEAINGKIVFLFSLSYWFSLLSLKFGFVFRIEPYFEFTNIYVSAMALKFLFRKSPLIGLLAFFYLILPGILKIMIFAQGEYLYTL